MELATVVFGQTNSTPLECRVLKDTEFSIAISTYIDDSLTGTNFTTELQLLENEHTSAVESGLILAQKILVNVYYIKYRMIGY